MSQSKSPLLSNPKIDPNTARAVLWYQSKLSWLLHPGQKDLYDSYVNCSDKIVVWNCSRRFGKSTVLCVLALEICLKKKNALVKYCCAKQIDAKGIIRPLVRQLIETCPKDLKPEYKTQERAYVFPNGSRIELSGLDGGKAESLRGGSADLAIIDEAGLVPDLYYTVNAIILPTTITTKGKIVLASTPPKTSAHSFIKDFVNTARIKGNLVTKTIYDNPLIDKDELQKIIDESHGVNSVYFRREYLAQIIIDEDYAIVPEFNPDTKEEIVQEWVKPPFYDGYVGMDLGVKDLTVVLFSYYDFRAGKLIIEDEFSINGQRFNTLVLAEGIKQKEKSSYTDNYTGEQKIPFLRVSDVNHTVINDLYQLHGIRFLPTRKDDADAALNNLRVCIQQRKIVINPRCKILIHHLETGVWNKNKTSFDRTAEGHHFDALDALKYLIRNVNFNKNPYPAHYFSANTHDTFELRKKLVQDTNAWKTALNLKK